MGIISHWKRIKIRMNEDHKNDPGPGGIENTKNRIIDMVFLPLLLTVAILGIGILSGLIFREHIMLQGPWRIVIGLALTAYGSIRSLMIWRRLFGHKKRHVWTEKY
jgi:hypothetical protein